MIVDEKLIVEVKSTYDMRKEEPRRVHSYLHATKLEVALLLHFGPEATFYRMISPNVNKRSLGIRPIR
jgi:GxxExxY protein